MEGWRSITTGADDPGKATDPKGSTGPRESFRQPRMDRTWEGGFADPANGVAHAQFQQCTRRFQAHVAGGSGEARRVLEDSLRTPKPRITERPVLPRERSCCRCRSGITNLHATIDASGRAALEPS